MSALEFRARVRAALAAPEDGSLAARFPAPFVTAIVAGAEPGDHERLEIALSELVPALHAVGVPRGRQFVLLGALLPGPAAGVVARLRDALGVPVLVHAPQDAHYTAAAGPGGEPYEFHDELREAEAVVVTGPEFAGADGLEGGAGLLCPGVSSPRTRAAWERSRASGCGAALAFSLRAERALAADLALLWRTDGSVTAGDGRARFTAIARGDSRAPARPPATLDVPD